MKTRGVADILIAVTDGPKGTGEALGAVFPATTLQACIVHLIRNNLDDASWKDRKLPAAALRPVYTAPSADAAADALDEFERGPCGQKSPTAVAAWRRAWNRVIPFFTFAPAVRRVVQTTHAIDSVHSRLCKIIETRGRFPSDDAATKPICLALRNITADRGRAAKEWREAMNPFAIAYGDRLTRAAACECDPDSPAASVVRRKRRPPPWTGLRGAAHTEVLTPPFRAARPPWLDRYDVRNG